MHHGVEPMTNNNELSHSYYVHVHAMRHEKRTTKKNYVHFDKWQTVAICLRRVICVHNALAAKIVSSMGETQTKTDVFSFSFSLDAAIFSWHSFRILQTFPFHGRWDFMARQSFEYPERVHESAVSWNDCFVFPRNFLLHFLESRWVYWWNNFLYLLLIVIVTVVVRVFVPANERENKY